MAVLSDAGGRDFFSLIHDLHETLLVDAKPVVEIAAWTMVGLILIGPVLAWPRLRNTLPGWHLGIGWILFPLVLLPAGTEALRTLGVARAQWRRADHRTGPGHANLDCHQPGRDRGAGRAELAEGPA